MPRAHLWMAAAVLLTAVPVAYGQDTQQADSPEVVNTPAPRVAVPRAAAPERARTPDRAAAQRRQPRDQAPGRAEAAPQRRSEAAAAAAAPAADDQRRAQPRASRPRGDNPPTGVAVPRSAGRDRGRPVPDPRRGGVYRNAPRVYNNYYYSYPRRYYPYGYGSFGLGYFYYDPYRWYPNGYGVYGSYGGYGGGYYPGYPGSYGYATGQLRLRVEPKHAEVYVDGYYAGIVDDYDGIAQGLTLEEGGYQIEIVAPGFEPIEVDVRIIPGRKISYRGVLRPRP